MEDEWLDSPFIADAASGRLPCPSSRKALACVGLMLTSGGDVPPDELDRIAFGLLPEAGISRPEEMDALSAELFVDLAFPLIEVPTGRLRTSAGVL